MAEKKELTIEEMNRRELEHIRGQEPRDLSMDELEMLIQDIAENAVKAALGECVEEPTKAGGKISYNKATKTLNAEKASGDELRAFFVKHGIADDVAEE